MLSSAKSNNCAADKTAVAVAAEFDRAAAEFKSTCFADQGRASERSNARIRSQCPPITVPVGPPVMGGPMGFSLAMPSQCLNIFCAQTTINTIEDRTIRLLIANAPLFDAESLDGAVVLGTGIGTGLPSGVLRFVGR